MLLVSLLFGGAGPLSPLATFDDVPMTFFLVSIVGTGFAFSLPFNAETFGTCFVGTPSLAGGLLDADPGRLGAVDVELSKREVGLVGFVTSDSVFPEGLSGRITLRAPPTGPAVFGARTNRSLTLDVAVGRLGRTAVVLWPCGGRRAASELPPAVALELSLLTTGRALVRTSTVKREADTVCRMGGTIRTGTKSGGGMLVITFGFDELVCVLAGGGPTSVV